MSDRPALEMIGDWRLEIGDLITPYESIARKDADADLSAAGQVVNSNNNNRHRHRHRNTSRVEWQRVRASTEVQELNTGATE